MAYRSERTSEDQSMVQLALRLVREAVGLARSHLHLAVAEMKRKGGRAATYVALIAAGVVLLCLCVLGAVASAVIVLALFLPLWVSALAITLGLLIGGGILTLVGLSGLKKMDWRPTEAIEALKESVGLLKTTKNSGA